MVFNKKPEIYFLLIILLMIPTLYLFTETIKEAKYKVTCTPVLYVDAGIPGEDVENLVHDDDKICKNRCNAYCMLEVGGACKGVNSVMYSKIYGVSCICELHKIDREFADACIDEVREEIINET